MPVPIIALHEVSVAYRAADGVRQVLRDISLSVHPGDFLALVGGNGSGKSTLARVVAGLCPISQGKVVRSHPPHAVQLVMQNPDAQIVGETVYEDVCFGLENCRFPREETPARVSAALSAVGLQGFANRRVDQLSGGEKQLLCIAGCLALEPEVMIFDEVTTMLDEAARKQMLAVAAELRRKGTAVIWVTQFMDEAARAGQVVALAEGKLAYVGQAESFFYNEKQFAASPCAALGFNPPYPVRVAQHLLAAGVELGGFPLTNDDLRKAVVRLCT
ncbi:MAG TPA: ATP-binding cassette domain-containing protein [Bacilli bacterium]